MLTIFTCPKPFKGHIDVIQRNAIGSWMRQTPRPEIILLGEDEGVADIARKFGLKHVPNIERNSHGTPLVSSVFEQGQQAAAHSIVAYINCDIILVDSFCPAIECSARFKKFLIVGRRWDLDVTELLNFDAVDWRDRLQERVRREGKLHAETGIDYFVFRKGSLGALPSFALGRTAWDNWILWHARSSGFAVVDVTFDTLVVHEAHRCLDGVREGLEAKMNLMTAENRIFDLLDCNYLITEGRVNPARGRTHVERRMERMVQSRPVLWRCLISWKVRYLMCYLFPSL